MIFKAFALRGSNGKVNFLSASTPPRGTSPDYLEAMRRASDYIVISHMGVIDGPILVADDGGTGLDLQPWAMADGTDDLQMMGAIHWTTVGRARENDVRILLMGCDSGVNYGKVVARYAQSETWGFKNHCPSAIPDFSIKAINGIKSGKPANYLVSYDGS